MNLIYNTGIKNYLRYATVNDTPKAVKVEKNSKNRSINMKEQIKI